MRYDYSKLLGRMREKGITQEVLARKVGMNPTTLNIKLNGGSEFKQSEMRNICMELDGTLINVTNFFYFKTLENASNFIQ